MKSSKKKILQNFFWNKEIEREKEGGRKREKERENGKVLFTES